MEGLTMYCKKYRCTMSEVACKLRRDNSLICNDRGVAVYKPGYSDVGCATCQQGKEIAASLEGYFILQEEWERQLQTIEVQIAHPSDNDSVEELHELYIREGDVWVRLEDLENASEAYWDSLNLALEHQLKERANTSHGRLADIYANPLWTPRKHLSLQNSVWYRDEPEYHLERICLHRAAAKDRKEFLSAFGALLDCVVSKGYSGRFPQSYLVIVRSLNKPEHIKEIAELTVLLAVFY